MKKNFFVFFLKSIFLMFIIYTFFNTYQLRKIMYQKKCEIILILNEIEKVEFERSKHINELKQINNPKYIEKIAREHLSYNLPNERIFIDKSNNDEDFTY